MIRPEEIELAPARDRLRSTYLGEGRVDEMVFTGALERMRVKLDNGATQAVLAHTNGGDTSFLEVTRAQHEQRDFQVMTGQNVAIGVRRVHVLPTPLSSFTACAKTAPDVERLSREPLLVELASRMKTRIASHVEPCLGIDEGPCGSSPDSFAGAAVIRAQGGAAISVRWLLEHGAEEVLMLPSHAGSPQRVLIYWDDEASRAATLAVSASLLRHLSAEAVYLDILPDSTPAAQRPHGMRALLDARSEAQAVHGLEMRTELRFGEVADELVRQLTAAPEQLLILGVSTAKGLEERFASLFNVDPRWPLLVVYRAPETDA